MKVGYVRISSVSQRPKLQRDSLEKFGCKKIYTDIASDEDEYPELTRMLGHLKKEDIVVVWRLDRLAHDSKRQLQLALSLEERGIYLISLEDGINTTTSAGGSKFKKSMRWALNNGLPAGTAVIYAWLKGYGHIKIENCKTGISDLDKIAEKALNLIGCDKMDSYPGFDLATYLIDAFGGEIERIEYGPPLTEA